MHREMTWIVDIVGFWELVAVEAMWSDHQVISERQEWTNYIKIRRFMQQTWNFLYFSSSIQSNVKPINWPWKQKSNRLSDEIRYLYYVTESNWMPERSEYPYLSSGYDIFYRSGMKNGRDRDIKNRDKIR